MRISLLILPFLLIGCSTAPLEISDRLTYQDPQPLQMEFPTPENLTLQWAPEPIEDFVISQNADGFTGRDEYRDFAVGQLISERVEEYLASMTELSDQSDNRVLVRIEGARLNYKYAWEELEYVKLLVNAEITVAGQSSSKVYYRQITEQPEMKSKAMLRSVFDGIAIEMGQNILRTIAE